MIDKKISTAAPETYREVIVEGGGTLRPTLRPVIFLALVTALSLPADAFEPKTTLKPERELAVAALGLAAVQIVPC